MNRKSNPPIVTLITDFGLHDEYAGVMKGVILGYAPEARIVDISHLIPPQSIDTAAHLLSRSYRYFPAATIHVVVVDPGVGSDRAILAIAADCQYFVGPDNGIFTTIFDCASSLAIHRVNTSTLRPNNISFTFHGRDIMAPVAGQLAMGLELSKLGPKISPAQCCRLTRAACVRLADSLQGEVVHVDAFGNLCTNIRRQDVEAFAIGHDIEIHITKDLLVPLENTYAARGKGMVLALFDSHDYLEIALRQGNAAQYLRLGLGSQIMLSRR